MTITSTLTKSEWRAIRFGGDKSVLLGKLNTIDTEVNLKATSASPTLTGTITVTGVTVGPAPIQATATTLTVTAATHAGKVIMLNRAAGIAVTLPAASGTGNIYTFYVETTFTGAATIKAASASDSMSGTATLFADGGDTVVGFGAVSGTDDTIDMLGTANSTGGIAGQSIVITDVASGKFQVVLTSDAGGTEATPFSATVA